MIRVSTLLVVLGAASAHADWYDLQLARLGNPQEGASGFTPQADGNFRSMARELAAAISSVNLAPPRTLGHSGFSITSELSVVSFSKDPALPTEQTFKGPLLIPSIHIRKGLPLSFELGARGAWIEKSRMGAATLELKWAVNEGFAFAPDIAIRGSITRLINGRDLDLTVGGLDLGIGKAFGVGGMVTLTPYVGWNLLFVGASSGSVDFRPSRSLAESDNPTQQFKDYYVFSGVQANANAHNRLYVGARFIGGHFNIGAEFSYSIIGRFRDTKTQEDRDVPSVLAYNVNMGLDY